jgi:hypothetical protein
MSAENKKEEKKVYEPRLVLSDSHRKLLIKQVTQMISDFVPEEYKTKKYPNEIDKDVAYHLDELLTIMAVLNSLSGAWLDEESKGKE